MNDQRITRLRREDLQAQVERIVPRRPEGTLTQLVQIFNGGAMGAAADLFYLGYPVAASGSETEGGAGSMAPDTANAIVVDVLHNAPSVGDILLAYAVAGRWVAERPMGNPAYLCMCSGMPCNLPWVDLTLSWSNSPSGAGSTTLFWTGNAWIALCADSILFSIPCSSAPELQATQYASCSGTFVSQCNLFATGSCGPPLSLLYTIPGTCFLSSLGYEGLTLTGPDTIPTTTCCWWCAGSPPSTLVLTHSFYGTVSLSLYVAHPSSGEGCGYFGTLYWDYPGNDLPCVVAGNGPCPATTVAISCEVVPAPVANQWYLNMGYGIVIISCDDGDGFAFCPNATHPAGTPGSNFFCFTDGLVPACIGGRPYSQSWTIYDCSLGEDVTITLAEP